MLLGCLWARYLHHSLLMIFTFLVSSLHFRSHSLTLPNTHVHTYKVFSSNIEYLPLFMCIFIHEQLYCECAFKFILVVLSYKSYSVLFYKSLNIMFWRILNVNICSFCFISFDCWIVFHCLLIPYRSNLLQ